MCNSPAWYENKIFLTTNELLKFSRAGQWWLSFSVTYQLKILGGQLGEPLIIFQGSNDGDQVSRSKINKEHEHGPAIQLQWHCIFREVWWCLHACHLSLLEEGSQNIRSSRSSLYIDNSRQSRTCEAMSQRAKQRKLRHYILFRHMFGGPHVPKFMYVGQRSPMLKSRLFISTLLRWSLLSLCCVIQTSWPESFQAILLSLGICLPSHCEVLRLQMNATTSAFPMGSKNWAGIARFVQQALPPAEL